MAPGNRSDARVVLALGTALLGPACCVSAATLVRTPDGPRRLGDLRVGDSVWAIDVATGAWVATQIVARRSDRRECLRLVHAAGALVCTPDHPIYAPETGTYEPASRWVEGARTSLLLARGEHLEVSPVLAVEAYAGVDEVVDITVASAHHNFVAGDVVVHNKSFAEDLPSADVEGPAFTLTVAEPGRRFEVRACIAGREPATGLYRSGLSLEILASSDPVPTTGVMSYAVYFSTGPESEVIDYTTAVVGRLDRDTLVGACATPLAIAFERLDDLPGDLEITWQLRAFTEPPDGTSKDDTLDIEIDG